MAPDDERPGEGTAQEAALEDDELTEVAGGRLLGPVQGGAPQLDELF